MAIYNCSVYICLCAVWYYNTGKHFSINKTAKILKQIKTFLHITESYNSFLLSHNIN